MAITFKTTKNPSNNPTPSDKGNDPGTPDDEPMDIGLGYSAKVTGNSKHLPQHQDHIQHPVIEHPPQLDAAPAPEGKAKVKITGKYIKTSPMTSKKEYQADELDNLLDATEGDEVLVGNKARVRSTKEGVAFRRKQVLRLLIRGVPKMTIAKHLGVTMKTIYDDAWHLTAEMREELRNFDYPGYIGMSLAFYEEARNVALRLATDTNERSNGVKMQALRAAVAAEDSKHNFLARIGLHKVTPPTDPFNSIQTGRHGAYSDENDIHKFLRLFESPVASQG